MRRPTFIACAVLLAVIALVSISLALARPAPQKQPLPVLVISGGAEAPSGEAPQNLGTLPSPEPTIVEPEAGREPGERSGKALMALVIDDFGTSLTIAQQIASLGGPSRSFTWAIMPDCSASLSCAHLADKIGQPYIVHLPMQAIIDPAGHRDYLIGTDSSPEQVRRQVERMRSLFPRALGVNNHRGSKATSSQNTMEAFGAAMADQNGWGFLDSRTSGKSVARSTVAKYGVPALANMAFIDGVSNLDYMKGQFAKALRIARSRGVGIAICHARTGTLLFLRWVCSQQFGGVQFVPLHQLWFPEEGARR